jgi:hypothetical protein
MPNIDQRILKLIELLKDNGRIRFDTDFCRDIGMKKQNLYNIKTGRNYFTPEHIEQIVKAYKVNANWIFGVSEKIFIKTNTKAYTKTPILD